MWQGCLAGAGGWGLPRHLEEDGHGTRALCAHVCPHSEFSSLFLSSMMLEVFGPHHSLMKENDPPMVFPVPGAHISGINLPFLTLPLE